MHDIRHYILFRDLPGCWCAAPPAFRDPTLDPLGCGKTPQIAIADLLGQREFQDRIDEEGWRFPVLADFIHVRERAAASFCGKDCEPGSARLLAPPSLKPGVRTGFL